MRKLVLADLGSHGIHPPNYFCRVFYWKNCPKTNLAIPYWVELLRLRNPESATDYDIFFFLFYNPQLDRNEKLEHGESCSEKLPQRGGLSRPYQAQQLDGHMFDARYLQKVAGCANTKRCHY